MSFPCNSSTPQGTSERDCNTPNQEILALTQLQLHFHQLGKPRRSFSYSEEPPCLPFYSPASISPVMDPSPGRVCSLHVAPHCASGHIQTSHTRKKKKKKKVAEPYPTLFFKAGCQCKLPWQDKCITKMLLMQAASGAAWQHTPSAPMVRKKTCSSTRRAGRSQPSPSSGLLKHHL